MILIVISFFKGLVYGKSTVNRCHLMHFLCKMSHHPSLQYLFKMAGVLQRKCVIEAYKPENSSSIIAPLKNICKLGFLFPIWKNKIPWFQTTKQHSVVLLATVTPLHYGMARSLRGSNLGHWRHGVKSLSLKQMIGGCVLWRIIIWQTSLTIT